MTQWNRTTLPTEADADELGNILVLYPSGTKAVYNWEDYIDSGMMKNGDAWMSLPAADYVEDEPEPISIVITSGDRQVTIFKDGYTTEVHTSEDPFRQPVVWKDYLGGIDGLLATDEQVVPTEDLIRQAAQEFHTQRKLEESDAIKKKTQRKNLHRVRLSQVMIKH